MDAQGVAIALEENVCRMPQTSSGDLKTNMFAREIARMRGYDSVICPERLRSVLAYVKSNGWRSYEDTIELMRSLGTRRFVRPVEKLELIFNAYNAAAIANESLDEDDVISLEIPIEEDGESDEELGKIESDGIVLGKGDSQYREIDFKLPDRVKGF